MVFLGTAVMTICSSILIENAFCYLQSIRNDANGTVIVKVYDYFRLN